MFSDECSPRCFQALWNMFQKLLSLLPLQNLTQEPRVQYGKGGGLGIKVKGGQQLGS